MVPRAKEFYYLREHAIKMYSAMFELNKIISSLREIDKEKINEIIPQVIRLESEADEIKHHILEKELPESSTMSRFITLVETQDEIMDEIEEIGKLLDIKGCGNVHADILDKLKDLSNCTLDTTNFLVEILETFHGEKDVNVRETFEKLDECTARHSKEEINLLKTIFEYKDELNAFHLSKIVNSFGKINTCIKENAETLKNMYGI